MGWVKIADSMAHHPKLIQAGPMAYALDVAGIAWCHLHDTDGLIPDAAIMSVLPGMKRPRTWAKTLEKVGRWSWEPEQKAWRIHDYRDHQLTRTERETRRKSGSLGGQKSAESRRLAAVTPNGSNGHGQAFASAPAAPPAEAHAANSAEQRRVEKSREEKRKPNPPLPPRAADAPRSPAQQYAHPDWTPLPDGWTPPLADLTWAQGQLGRDVADQATAEFTAHYRDTGERRGDWTKVFRAWVRDHKLLGRSPAEAAVS